MPGRTFSAGSGYRYGFNGIEREVGCNCGELFSADLREYDSRIGRWWSIDPYGEFWSPYTGIGNSPIKKADPTGGCTTCPDSRKILEDHSDGMYIHVDPNGSRHAATKDGWVGVLDEVIIKPTKSASWGAGAVMNPVALLHRAFDNDAVGEASSLMDQAFYSLTSTKKVILTGDLLQAVKDDDAMKKREEQLKNDAMAYFSAGVTSMAYDETTVVGFGGKRYSFNTLLDFGTMEESKVTYSVVANKLTWSVRNATIRTNVSIHRVEGVGIAIVMQHHLFDTWDLSPQGGRSSAYNSVSTVTGGGYHYILGGNKNMQVTASWTTVSWIK